MEELKISDWEGRRKIMIWPWGDPGSQPPRRAAWIARGSLKCKQCWVLLDFSLSFYSFITSRITCGIKSWGNLEGCSEESYATVAKVWLSLFPASFLSHISIGHTVPKLQSQRRWESTLPLTRDGLVIKTSVSLFPAVTAWMGSSLACRVVNTKFGDVKTNEQNISLGVLGPVRDTYGKIANCSVSIWICLGSLSQNTPPLTERSELCLLVRVQIPQWKGHLHLGRGGLGPVLAHVQIEGLAGAVSLWQVNLSPATGIGIDNLTANFSDVAEIEWHNVSFLASGRFSIQYCNIFLLSQISNLPSLYIATERLTVFEGFVLTLIFWGTRCSFTVRLGFV